jgi:hypothetical protein
MATRRTTIPALAHAIGLVEKVIAVAQRFPFAEPDYLGGVSLFDGWPFGPVVAFGAVAGEPLGLPRSGPAIMPLVLSELVILPLLLLVMPLVKVLPRTPACEVGRLCVVCCAIAVVPDKASRPTAR